MGKKSNHNPDYTRNRTADVVKHGDGRAIPNEHWQINLNLTPAGNDSPEGAFLPREGRNRPTPHTKINECDH